MILPIYRLLTDIERETLRQQLGKEHAYFYHCSLDRHIESIKACGLDPAFEGPESGYPGRNREPAKAIRYCTGSFVERGLSAANTRNQVWNDDEGLWLPGTSKVIVFRAKAASLLSRAFGLDHSFGDVSQAVEALLSSKPMLSAEDFRGILRRYGSISCYERIPSEELEICTGGCLSACAEFIPLKAYP